MRVIIVDSDYLSRIQMEQLVRAVKPEAMIRLFKSSLDAYHFLEENPCDVAILEIAGIEPDGITLARMMVELQPELNLIFATSCSQYALEAFEVNASAYLLKPIKAEQVARAFKTLRFPPKRERYLYAHCFGTFALFCNGRPMRFRRAKTKELFAYLIDRRGAGCTMKEIVCALWEDEGHESYYKQIRKDLLDTFTEHGLQDMIIRGAGTLSVNFDEIDSDLKDYLNGKKTAESAYYGEYMSQYSWAEQTNAWLQIREGYRRVEEIRS